MNMIQRGLRYICGTYGRDTGVLAEDHPYADVAFPVEMDPNWATADAEMAGARHVPSRTARLQTGFAPAPVAVPCPRWSLEQSHAPHEWTAPVDGWAACPGWRGMD